jgi:predicted nucleic-acid-binding Zn-ribbon protein
MILRSLHMPLTCKHCGSDKIIPGVPLLDAYGEQGWLTKPQEVKVQGKPGAWVFKETATGNLLAKVCGECGYTELYTTHHRELYDAYQRSRQG